MNSKKIKSDDLFSMNDQAIIDFIKLMAKESHGQLAIDRLRNNSLINGNKKLVHLLNEVSHDLEINKIRQLISDGDIVLAKEKLAVMKPLDINENIEKGIEESRILFIEKKYEASINSLLRVRDVAKDSSLISYMTINQQIGSCYFRLEQFQSAKEYLTIASELSEQFQQANSGFCANAFLVLCYLKDGNVIRSKYYLNKMKTVIDELKSMDEKKIDRIYSYSRVAREYFKFTNDELRAESYARASIAIAYWQKNSPEFKKCSLEYKAESMDFENLTCAFLKEFEVLLDFKNAKLENYQDKEQFKNILMYLQKPVHIAEFSNSIWGIDYYLPENGAKVRALLAKVRKFLPSGCLKLKDSMLSTEGLVLV
jgi:hypothetical protein